MDLLLEIARCANIRSCLDNPKGDNPCAALVGQQQKSLEAISDFQLPAPWIGHIDQAPLLFVSSNPSISEEDAYPRWSWSDNTIVDFFDNGFSDSSKAWIKDGRYYLLRDETTRETRAVRYWAAIRQRAIELSERGKIRPGADYALSEIVHCKSIRERGLTKEVVDKCGTLYLRRLVEAAAAKVVVFVGQIAEDSGRVIFGIPNSSEHANLYGPMKVGNSQRYFAFLPHPNSFKKKTFSGRFSPEELARLRGFLAMDTGL